MTKAKSVVSRPSTVSALLNAYRRLEKGKATIALGCSLTLENVALEAGVSRATAYRCNELRKLFEKEVSPEEIETAAAKAVDRASTESELRANLRRACNRIILLEEKGRADQKEILRLRRRCGEAADNVVPIRD